MGVMAADRSWGEGFSAFKSAIVVQSGEVVEIQAASLSTISAPAETVAAAASRVVFHAARSISTDSRPSSAASLLVSSGARANSTASDTIFGSSRTIFTASDPFPTASRPISISGGNDCHQTSSSLLQPIQHLASSIFAISTLN